MPLLQVVSDLTWPVAAVDMTEQLGARHYTCTSNRDSSRTNKKYAATVIAHVSAKAGQKATPRWRAAEKTKDNGNDAKISQNILCDSAATAWVLPVSV